MTQRRGLFMLAGIALVVVGLVGTVLSFRGSDSSSEAAAPTTTAVPSRVPPGAGVAAESPKERVARLQALVEQAPKDWTALAGLGSAYIAEAAVSGDPTLYPRAQESIERSLKVHPKDNLPATIAQASLAAARHDFSLALDWGSQATELAPANPNALAVKGDALLELGRYDEAFTTFQMMIDLRPDLPSYSRISYARELQGDIDGAVTAMKAAEDAASSPSDAGFAAYQLGQLEWNRGDVEAATANFERSAKLDPDAVRSRAALARARYFAGDVQGAIAQYRDVVQRLPLPQYLTELSEIYDREGMDDKRDEQLRVLEAQRKLFKANGVRVDADLAVVNADNRTDLAASLATMEAEWKIRKNVFVADALSWLLQVNGRSQEALTYADEAEKLGTRNALFSFHRSEILDSLGDPAGADAARAEVQAINPNFSIRYAKGP